MAEREVAGGTEPGVQIDVRAPDSVIVVTPQNGESATFPVSVQTPRYILRSAANPAGMPIDLDTADTFIATDGMWTLVEVRPDVAGDGFGQRA